jgi:hypothetical protein
MALPIWLWAASDLKVCHLALQQISQPHLFTSLVLGLPPEEDSCGTRPADVRRLFAGPLRVPAAQEQVPGKRNRQQK